MNLPNKLTVMRMILIPFFVFLCLLRILKVMAIILQ